MVRDKMTDEKELDLISLTADIVSAYVTHNVIGFEKLPDFIGTVHAALSNAGSAADEPPMEELKPAVPIKKSLTAEYIICLEDGKKFKSLKRHLSSVYDMSPEQYREKWGLPRDYPMVAPAYAEARSKLAKSMGLGRPDGAKSAAEPAAKEPEAAKEPDPAKAAKSGAKRGRKAA
jgi:predicted transcriptional regulator